MRGFDIEVRQNGLDGWQERFRGSLNALAVEEGAARNRGRETKLKLLLEYWNSIRTGSTVWQKRFVESLPDALRNQVGYIDVRPASPLNFMLLNHPSNPIKGLGDELSNKRLADYPIVSHAKFCASEYVECRDKGAPHYSLIDQELKGFRRRYVRFMAPLTDLDGRVIRISYACRSLQRPRVIAA